MRSTNRRSFPFDFLCANIGLADWLKGKVVMTLHLFSRVGCTRRSSLRLIGAPRLRLQAGLLTKGANCTLNSVLNPMSKLCRAKMSWNSKSRSSTACLAWSCKVDPVQSKIDRNWSRESISSGGFNCSNYSSSRNSLRIRVWMGIFSLSLPWFCGIGNQ